MKRVKNKQEGTSNSYFRHPLLIFDVKKFSFFIDDPEVRQ